MRPKLVILGFILTLSFVSSVQAQVTLDASKVTCDQWVHSKIGSPRLLAAWFSGFYNGKRDNPIIDKQHFEATLNKMEHFCYEEKHFDVLIMKAIEQVVGTDR